MDRTGIDRALHILCQRFNWHCDVEILIVGGAAGMVTGLLSPDRTTRDCDVISYIPNEAWSAVEAEAEKIGTELNLPIGWFNSNVKIREDSLPDGWKERRILVDQGGRLSIYAAGRQDLIAMKFLAHRSQDIEDLIALNVAEADRIFVRQFLMRIREAGSHAGEINEAQEVLESWQVRG
jgi:Nucleotidyltransferase of unknown function (DUF6036)